MKFGIEFMKNPSKRSDFMKFWIFRRKCGFAQFREIQVSN